MLEELFGTNKPVIGVVHLLPLPGSPRWDGQMEPIFQRAEQEAMALATGGVNGIMVENFFDAPFTGNRVDAATSSALALAVRRIMNVSDLPVGVNVLRNDGLTALAIACVTGAQFIRVNVLSGAMVTDQGLLQGIAHELHLYRRQLGLTHVKVLADVMVKHASPLGAQADIKVAAQDTVYRALADAVIVSGRQTGAPPDAAELSQVREALPSTPIFVGSGASRENIASLLRTADGVIVASSLKRQGLLENPIDVERVRAFVSSVSAAATA